MPVRSKRRRHGAADPGVWAGGGAKAARRYDFDLDAPAADEEELHPVCGSFLEEVTLPDSVQVIGSCAFYNCRSLRLLTVGSGGLTVGSDVFLNCFALETLRVQAAPEQPLDCLHW